MSPSTAAILLANKYENIKFAERYGGSLPEGSDPTPVDRVLNGAGAVLTISGRTIRPEARVDPSIAAQALESVRALLKEVPSDAETDTAFIVQQAPKRT